MEYSIGKKRITFFLSIFPRSAPPFNSFWLSNDRGYRIRYVTFKHTISDRNNLASSLKLLNA